MFTTDQLFHALINRPYTLLKLNELNQDSDFYYLYKHTRVDERQLVFNIFNNCQLKFSKPIDFNDPYDCHFENNINFKGLTRKNFNKEHNLKIRTDEWEETKEKYKMTLTKLIKKNYLNDIRNKYFTVACFNNNPLNILMWSHYADNHKGFLIEFKFPKKDLGRLPIPVEYTNEYPIVSLPYSYHAFNQNLDLQIENTRKIFYTKSSDWNYENEYRLINIKDELALFPANLISSVIFGTNTPPSIKQTLNEIIKNFNLKNNLIVKTYQTELVKKQYRLIVPNHPRLDG